MSPLPALLALALADPASGPAPPGSATVFIRVSGDVVAEYVQGWQQKKSRPEVEIASGSGFLLSASGYVLTNHHVVAGGEVVVPSRQVDVGTVRVRTEVKRIDVVVPPGEGGGERVFEASVVATDPGLDLALLSLDGADLPWLPLGDSDALEMGQAVTAWGFPLGGAVEVGRARGGNAPPRVAASPGSVAALRADDEGDARYIQTDVTLNPGNSGGPLVDEDGYVVGIVRMKLANGDRVGFAIPVDLAKDFVEAHLPPGVLPVRLRLGSLQSFDWKGLRLRLPEGLEDVSPARVRWSSGKASDGVSLVIDRIASPWSAVDVEAHFVAGGLGGRPLTPRSRARAAGRARDRFGAARARDLELEYAVLDVGREKLVARFAGRPPIVAYNRGVLRRSLESLEAERLLTAEVAAAAAVRLEPVPLSHPRAPAVFLPVGWTREGTDAFKVPGLGAATAGALSSPEGDFTVSCRALWWESGTVPRDLSPGGGYRRREERLGVGYQIEGLFLPLGGGVLALELQAPEAKAKLLDGLLPAWRTAAAESASPR